MAKVVRFLRFDLNFFFEIVGVILLLRIWRWFQIVVDCRRENTFSRGESK